METEVLIAGFKLILIFGGFKKIIFLNITQKLILRKITLAQTSVAAWKKINASLNTFKQTLKVTI